MPAALKPTALRGLPGDLRALLEVYRGGDFAHEGEGTRSRTAVVLGAQVLPGGRASRTLEARVRHAARLYVEGELDLLVPTGGLGKHPPDEASIMSRILRDGGVPEGAIVREGKARNTWESALLVAGIARGRGIRAVRVVTDPLHCVRAVGSFEEAGLVARAEPVYSSPMWRVAWLRRGQFLREIGALVWYRARHGVGSRSRR